MFTPILGEMIQIDEHIFQMGCRNSTTPNQQCFPSQQTSTPGAGSTADVFGGGVVHFLGSATLDSLRKNKFFYVFLGLVAGP